jgi:putative ABC transport system ATP-binding protein
MEPILETKGLSKIYQSGDLRVQAVDRASIRVGAGEFIALVGPSGSGKTTMLAMLAALLSPSEGQVLIDGQDLGGMSESQRVRFRREKIGFTFQSNNLVPYLTVRENVELMLRLNRGYNPTSRRRAQELLERLGLGERMDSLPSQLSGGQKQRAAIARALIHNPSLVLADEPTASLDSERAFQVVGLFADLIHAEGKAGIMVTHDLRLCRFVDKVIQMEDGRVVKVIDDPSRLYRDPSSQSRDPAELDPGFMGAEGGMAMPVKKMEDEISAVPACI